MLRICVLASGSGGNCTYIASKRTSVLVDAGLSALETSRRLAAVGCLPAQLQGILFTHEHTDHTVGAAALSRRYGIALYANSGTIEGMERNPRMRDLSWTRFITGSPFLVGDLTVEPFSVPHDCSDPVGFLLHAGGTRVGLVTDMGMTTSLIRERLRRCHALVIECNHEEQLLMDCERPWTVKQRIAGNQGHLSNRDAAELIGDVAGPQLKRVYLAHLSEECNRPQTAFDNIRDALKIKGLNHVEVCCAWQKRPSEIWQGDGYAEDAGAVIADIPRAATATRRQQPGLQG